MAVDRISLRYKVKTESLKGFVYIVDENGNEVSKAVVHAVWTLPDDSKVDQYKTINKKSLARFTLNANSSGQYALTITEVTKEGYIFDPDNSNTLSGIIDITQ